MSELDRLQQRLGYQFNDPGLLRLALTHRSMGRHNNERLEFLGDSIVNHVIATALFLRFEDAREGELSRLRASLVKGETLAEIAGELELGELLQLGVGERKSGGHRRASILADALEAVAGAILLDSSMESCAQCIRRWFASRLDTSLIKGARKDAKTRLQEYLQARGEPLPSYTLLARTGADHQQRFEVCCELNSLQLTALGEGSSLRKAEQIAARRMLEELQADG